MSTPLERREVSASWMFRDTEYLVSCSITEKALEVMVEEPLTTNQWKGRFEAKHIEELTRKTGNFKHFSVFATMLESAINKSSECVTLDLLTYADLEVLRERKNGTTVKRLSKPAVVPPDKQHQNKKYLILTYSVEFDRIHYPLALPFAGQADPAQLKNTILRLAAELEKHKRQGRRHTALARLQKDYDALLQEKEALEETVEAMQAQLLSVGTENTSKQLAMLRKVIRSLEEELLQEKSKHQRYVNKKTEEMRAQMQELGELRSSERTLRSRVKNLTNELSVLKKGLRSSPSMATRPRQSGSFKKTPSPAAAGGLSSLRRRSHSGSLERRQRTGSHERQSTTVFSGRSRLRTPSPRGGQLLRFDPSAYVENKRRQQKENEEKLQRLRSPSYHGPRSRSSSAEKIPYTGGSGGTQRHRTGSRRLWGSTSGNVKGKRTRSSSLGSLSGRSSRGSSAASSRASSRHPSLTHLSDIDPSPPTSGRQRSTGRATNKRKGHQTGSSRKHHSSTPVNAKGSKNGSSLDHSAEMLEIDARLNALQQFMKRSLEATKSQSKR